MSRPHKPTMPLAAVEFLAEQLAAISKHPSRAHYRRHDSRVRRLAVSFRPCQRQVDLLPESRIPLDAFRLFSLSHRWIDRRGRVTPVVVLGISKAEVDLPGTGRIRFRCEAAMSVGGRAGSIAPDPQSNPTAARAAVVMAHEIQDAEHHDLEPDLQLPQFYFAFDNHRCPVREPHVTPEQWAASETRIGDLRAWPAECFARPRTGQWEAHPGDDSPNPWTDRDGPAQEGAVLGSWIFRDGVATPRAQEPDAIFADLRELGGRILRNPAWQVLARCGVIDPNQTYRQWLEATCPLIPNGRQFPTSDRPTPGTARFLASLVAWVDTDAGNVPLLLGLLRNACLAVGVPVPEDPEMASEFLLGLAEAPWVRIEVPGVARVQRIRLVGDPDPGTMAFSTGTVEADLSDLGEMTARYESVPTHRVAEALLQKFGKSKSGL